MLTASSNSVDLIVRGGFDTCMVIAFIDKDFEHQVKTKLVNQHKLDASQGTIVEVLFCQLVRLMYITGYVGLQDLHNCSKKADWVTTILCKRQIYPHAHRSMYTHHGTKNCCLNLHMQSSYTVS